VVKQVAPLCIRVDRHVLFRPRERPTPRDSLNELAEFQRVKTISEGKEVWKKRELGLREIRKRCKVPGLINLENIDDKYLEEEL
jgi:hypothetical protein